MTSDGWDSEEMERGARLAGQMRARSGVDARLFAVRAPGRVNLIGEHTDYSGLPVLPVAIDRSTIIVASANSTREIELSNADPAWPPRRFAVERQIPPYATGDWANYVKAAVQGVIDHFATRDDSSARDKFRGASMVVEGRVPTAAGLSSSAALTVASALAFIAINGLEIEPIAAAAMIARSEWYVGTRAGGMDQAASILGRRDYAMFIEFGPLRVRMVKMPANAALVVADSGTVADKSGRVRAQYNRRVEECAEAARILGSVLKIDNVKILGDVVRAMPNANWTTLVDTLAASAASPVVVRRARHVLSENERVIRAAAALEAGRLDEVGKLMNESHRSLADEFECSTPALDALVESARRGGALGARLTGAGFGGSIVALCEAENVAAVIDSIDNGFYAKLDAGAPAEKFRGVLRAGAGASVIELAVV